MGWQTASSLSRGRPTATKTNRNKHSKKDQKNSQSALPSIHPIQRPACLTQAYEFPTSHATTSYPYIPNQHLILPNHRPANIHTHPPIQKAHCLSCPSSSLLRLRLRLVVTQPSPFPAPSKVQAKFHMLMDNKK
ncbi:hypothetical protein VTJ04DRAFT_6566 [Mycothermus thermophilus]|uniref:uncharacterized protein n=1 Tax=Humicola insolens TaxID=85995 RepID=UPI0037437722